MDKRKFLNKLGENVVKLRSEKNWSQSDLARACFKDRQSVERLENGKINPSIFQLKEIADALEMPVSQLVSFEYITPSQIHKDNADNHSCNNTPASNDMFP